MYEHVIVTPVKYVPFRGGTPRKRMIRETKSLHDLMAAVGGFTTC